MSLRQADINIFLFPGMLVRRRAASGSMDELLRASGLAAGEACLVVADKHVHSLGLADPMLAALQRDGIPHAVVASISAEPDAQLVDDVAREARRIDARAVIGIGGGSALDTAKLAAFQSVRDGNAAELRGPLPHVRDFPLLILVPTTVGTGAEATRVAMFSVDGSKRATLTPQFVPTIAVLDADLVADLPGPVVAATALDALSHAVESMMSTEANALTWQFAASAARTIFEVLPRAVDGDRAARAELLFASFQAGVSLNAGVVLGHSLSYVISASCGLSHGVGCALALPYCIAYNQGMPEPTGRAIAEAVLGRTSVGLRDLATAVAELATVVKLPSALNGFGVDVSAASALAHRTSTEYPRPTNPVPLDDALLETLIEHLVRGDLVGALDSLGGSNG